MYIGNFSMLAAPLNALIAHCAQGGKFYWNDELETAFNALVLWLDGPFGPRWCSFRVEVATRLWSRRSQAKSFSADLGGNESNHSKFDARSRIANEVKLRA